MRQIQEEAELLQQLTVQHLGNNVLNCFILLYLIIFKVPNIPIGILSHY